MKDVTMTGVFFFSGVYKDGDKTIGEFNCTSTVRTPSTGDAILEHVCKDALRRSNLPSNVSVHIRVFNRLQ